MLYSCIQNKYINIRTHYSETHFNELIKEEHTFKETCKDILSIETETNKWIYNNNRWKKQTIYDHEQTKENKANSSFQENQAAKEVEHMYNGEEEYKNKANMQHANKYVIGTIKEAFYVMNKFKLLKYHKNRNKKKTIKQM